jgi:hypothetical protein
MCADFREDVHILVEFPWRTIIPQLIRDAIKKWTSLKEHMKQRYIETAKYEYFLYTAVTDEIAEEEWGWWNFVT